MTATSTVLPPGVGSPKKASPPPSAPMPDADWSIPKLLFTVEDMAHPGALRVFQSMDDPVAFLQASIVAIFELLFTKKSVPRNVRLVSIIFRSMGGIAYTTGSRLDNNHKEIHFSLDYISHIGRSQLTNEIQGVLQHELVHCFQNDGKGSCPGGLIEGMADYVRLIRHFVPPHWKRAPGDKWDAGYQSTAYFLDWVDQEYGQGIVRKLNESMAERYEEHIWKDLTGHPIASLWRKYCHGFDSTC